MPKQTALRPPAKRPKNRKAQISQAAAQLFCERGYHGVGIDEIAAAVGISGPAVYRHFPNKYAVLVHATHELSDAVRVAVETAVETVGTPAERVDALLAALARLSVERRADAGLYQWEGRYLTEPHRLEFSAELAALIRLVAGPVAQFRPDLDRHATGLLSRSLVSVFGSLATHRTPVPRSRAEAVLTQAGWALVGVSLPPLDLDRQARSSAVDAAVGPAAAVQVRSRREILINESLRLFHRNGYHAVGIEDIGRAAGINASSVYRYFPSKADLLAAAYYRAAERLNASVTASLAAASDADDALRRMVDAHVDLTFGQPDLVSVYLAENNNLPEQDR
nr:TetR/AcrR family transcriptional regulator [Micromonospora sp. DSM 115978]